MTALGLRLSDLNSPPVPPVDSDINDDPDENITASKVTCQGGTSGSEYCKGYQQGYADEDHAMFSPH
jgi:hypothetical protein